MSGQVTVAQQRQIELRDFETALVGQADKFAAALGPSVKPERFIRAAINGVVRNPDLLGFDRKSLFIACMEAAEDGLIPDGREGAFVPRKGKVCWQPMVAGLVKLAWQSGVVASIHADVIYEGEPHRIVRGSDPRIEHEYDASRRGSGNDETNVLWVYAVAALTTGRTIPEAMSKAEIKRIQGRSEARNGPWKTDWCAMAMVRPIRRVVKLLPQSNDPAALRFLRAAERVDAIDSLEIEADEPAGPLKLEAPAEKLDALEAAIAREPAESVGATIDGAAEPTSAPAAAAADAEERRRAEGWVKTQIARLERIGSADALLEWSKRMIVLESRERMRAAYPDIEAKLQAAQDAAQARLSAKST